ncbi:biotin--[acetyl-CoA-carboxylase] ligase [Fuerstiella marisgermanici]|uniref:Bifunctional protein BirA n=1 Tax=Fuerstiella marisgermanici TaxID=1891926 RepID=A0A1P8WK58_9PLAN|nr:biotin--[acetyl-CoA-carboxylase] ligase [Fuerstiella marisgermanici]APZ94443.1 Bifunctional protein BirA [Fuerstiella marisgermanici]
MFDLRRITRETNVRFVEYHETLDSTNKLAAELLSDLLPLSPSLVLTSCQTAGRGRGANTWWATPGALTFSLVLAAEGLSLSTERLPFVSLAAGLAVRNALAALVPEKVVSVKWPNDVLISEQKVCGILTQQHAAQSESGLIIGIGVNVNNSLNASPDTVRQKATSVFDLSGTHHDLTDVLVGILTELTNALTKLRDDDKAIVAELNAHSILNGRSITVQTGETTIHGTCDRVDDDGCLLVRVGKKTHQLNAGTVLDW